MQVNTGKLILDALQELYNEYDPVIKNIMYRGSMKEIPSFTLKQIAEKVPRTIVTIRKWCHRLQKDKKITMNFKEHSFYTVSRIDFKPIQLKDIEKK